MILEYWHIFHLTNIVLSNSILNKKYLYQKKSISVFMSIVMAFIYIFLKEIKYTPKEFGHLFSKYFKHCMCVYICLYALNIKYTKYFN